MSKSFSLKDYTSFERAFHDWMLHTKGDKMVGWISACSNVWGTYFAKTRFRMYKNTSNGKKELLDHDFIKLMRRPNEYQVGWEQKYMIALYWILYGKAYLLKLRNGLGQPGKLVMLKPWRVEIVGSKTAYIDSYKYDTGSEIIPLKKEDVIHLKLPDPDSFTDGRPVIEGFLDTQAVDELQMAYQKKFLEEGGFAGRTFVAKQEMGDATFNRIYEQLKTQYGGQENAFKVALLELVEPVKAAYSIKDMDIVRQRMLTRDEILGGMQVPKILLGIGESVNRQTAETAVWQFASGIIDPYMDYIEEVLTLHVQMDYNSDALQIIHDKVAPRDQDSAIENEIKLLQNGLITLNEGRDANNLPRYDFEVANKPLFAVGGALVNIEDNETIGSDQQADNQLQMNGDTEDEDKKFSLLKSEKDLDTIWKQFDRRHIANAEKMTRSLKRFFDLQKDRLIKELSSKATGGDLEQFYLSEEELQLIQAYLQQEYLRTMQRGYEWGVNTFDVSQSFFNTDNKFVASVLNSVDAQALGIQETTLKDIRNFIGEEINSMSNAELSRVIKLKYNEMSDNRIFKIVNTTITAGLNAGLLHAAQDAGATRKMWLSEKDSRVRARVNYNHKVADGQWVDLDKTFLVSGEELMFPCDPSASAGNAVNCRCTMAFNKE